MDVKQAKPIRHSVSHLRKNTQTLHAIIRVRFILGTKNLSIIGHSSKIMHVIII